MTRLLRMPLSLLSLMVQSIFLALGQIWANKSRSILTTLGIVIGVASVIAVIAALTGLKAKILDEFESAVGSNTIFIFARRPDEGPQKYASWYAIRLTPEHVEGLKEACPSVETFTRLTGNQMSVRFGDRVVEDASIRGVDTTWHDIERRAVIMGRPFTPVDNEQARQVCLVAPAIRDKLLLDRDCTQQTIMVGGRSFRIVGVVEKPTRFMDRGGDEEMEVFIPFNTAWKLKWFWMMVRAKSKSAEVAEEAQGELRYFLRSKRNLAPGEPDNFRIEVMERHLQEFHNIAMIMTAVAGGIVGISLLVGGIGIMNIMLVSVSERTREIGLRKAVGARPAAILLQFLVEAIVLCLFGGFLGLLFAQLLTMGIANIPNAEMLEMAHIPLWAIGVAFGFSTLVGICFGMFPAIKAARLDPIVALRHE